MGPCSIINTLYLMGPCSIKNNHKSMFLFICKWYWLNATSRNVSKNIRHHIESVNSFVTRYESYFGVWYNNRVKGWEKRNFNQHVEFKIEIKST